MLVSLLRLYGPLAAAGPVLVGPCLVLWIFVAPLRRHWRVCLVELSLTSTFLSHDDARPRDTVPVTR